MFFQQIQNLSQNTFSFSLKISIWSNVRRNLQIFWLNIRKIFIIAGFCVFVRSNIVAGYCWFLCTLYWGRNCVAAKDLFVGLNILPKLASLRLNYVYVKRNGISNVSKWNCVAKFDCVLVFECLVSQRPSPPFWLLTSLMDEPCSYLLNNSWFILEKFHGNPSS